MICDSNLQPLTSNFQKGGIVLDKIKVALIDDHNILRQSLARAIGQEFDIEVFGQWGNAEDAIREIRDVSCDVVIMDLKLPGMDGISATRKLREIDSRVKVIMLSAYFEDEELSRAIGVGALGYLPKEVTIEELVDAIRSVYRGYAVLDPMLAKKMIEQYADLQNRIRDYSGLDCIEREVLVLASEGLKNNDIADKMNLNEGAVKFHFREIYRKMNAKDRAHAVAIALKQGLI
jgi:DNA-binding NarL/FixJ family response regulator